MALGWTITNGDPEVAKLSLSPRLITVDEFERMIEAGVFAADERVELIDGALLPMTPIGSRHAACVKKISALFFKLFGDSGKCIVGVQDPVAIKGDSRPQPDLSLLRPREDFYSSSLPGPDDILLVVEVADTSFRSDKRVKLPMYAKAGVAEVWLVDLLGGAIELHREPNAEAGAYENCQRLERTDAASFAPLAFPDAAINASDLLLP